MENPDREQVRAILTMLVAVHARPGLYMPSIQEIDGFIEGALCAACFLGMRPDPAIYSKVVRGRGWKVRGRLLRQHLQAQTSFSDDEIARELLTIELETWRRAYNMWEEIVLPRSGPARVLSREELDATIARREAEEGFDADEEEE